MLTHSEIKKRKRMEQVNLIRRKGGGPKKVVKRNRPLTVKCNIIERKVIERKAKEAGLTVFEYLRNTGLAAKKLTDDGCKP